MLCPDVPCGTLLPWCAMVCYGVLCCDMLEYLLQWWKFGKGGDGTQSVTRRWMLHPTPLYDIILDSIELIDHSQAVALTYCETYTLRRRDLETVLREFPQARERVRRRMRCVWRRRAPPSRACARC